MKILIVDDDRVLADILAYTFRREGFKVVLAYDGPYALEQWEEENPDLIVLDINLPGMDGFAVCEHIRRSSNVPVLMLTVRGEDDDVVQGLEIGADDYVSKPFSPRQLVARAHAVLRRSTAATAAAQNRIGDWILDANFREIRIGGAEPIQLSDLEFRLMEYLMLNCGQTMSTDEIFSHVWGDKNETASDLRQLVRRLRNKIEPDPSNPTYLINIPGLGYGLLLGENGA